MVMEPRRIGMREVLSDLVFGESARWHNGCLWLCDWGTGEVLVVPAEGQRQTVLHVDSYPLSIDWLSDGRLLAVAGGSRRVLRLEPDGSVVLHADLSEVSAGVWNEIAVDSNDTVFANGGNGVIAAISPGGIVRQVADGLAWPNGMVVAADGSTLIVAESHAHRLTAFDITPSGDLAGRRVWAELGEDNPDGICLDTDGAVWYADVPHRCCRRVREGGNVMQTVEFDRGCFSCALSGTERPELFVVATEWNGFERMFTGPRTGVVAAVDTKANS